MVIGLQRFLIYSGYGSFRGSSKRSLINGPLSIHAARLLPLESTSGQCCLGCIHPHLWLPEDLRVQKDMFRQHLLLEIEVPSGPHAHCNSLSEVCYQGKTSWCCFEQQQVRTLSERTKQLREWVMFFGVTLQMVT